MQGTSKPSFNEQSLIVGKVFLQRLYGITGAEYLTQESATQAVTEIHRTSEAKTSSPMDNNRSLGSQHNVCRLLKFVYDQPAGLREIHI